MAKETEKNKEPKNFMGKALGGAMDKIHSMFGGKPSDRMEGSDEYHDRRTNEELKGSGALDTPSHTSSDEHASIEHPALKILLAKLNLKKDDGEPSGKGGFVGMGNKI